MLNVAVTVIKSYSPKVFPFSIVLFLPSSTESALANLKLATPPHNECAIVVFKWNFNYGLIDISQHTIAFLK